MDTFLIEDLTQTTEDTQALAAWPTNDIDFRKVFYYSHDALIVSSPDGRVLLNNPASARLLGICVGTGQSVAISELMAMGIYERSTALEATRLRKRVSGFISTHGELTSVSTSTPVLDANGQVEMVITNTRDRRHLDELTLLNLEQERAQKNLYRRAASYLGQVSLSGQRIIAESTAMRDVLDMVETVAPTGATVLLSGESGTGKDLLAQHVHHVSPRRREPFIPVNCAAIPHELMESEFFGYAKGAFTGANSQGKLGLLEIAHRGTFFLDEIGELPLSLQSKLLRTLETGEIQRVGDTQRRRVDVRIVAATNRDLREMVRQKRFREDLYYRLNVIPLVIPPLRDRCEDIFALAELFLAEFCRKYSVEKHFTQDALGLLAVYEWPGNIRELRNLVERMAIVSRSAHIDGQLCATILTVDTKAADRRDTAVDAEQPEPLESLRAFRLRTEKAYIERMLNLCRGNVNKAALNMGIHKTALYRKLDAHGLRARLAVED